MSSSDHARTDANDSGTESKIDTPLTQRRSWIVRDNDDKPWGPFNTPEAAKVWAEKKWPYLEWYDEGAMGGFWDLEMIWPPDAPNLS